MNPKVPGFEKCGNIFGSRLPEQNKSSFLKIPKVPGFEKCGNIFGSRLPEHIKTKNIIFNITELIKEVLMVLQLITCFLITIYR